MTHKNREYEFGFVDHGGGHILAGKSVKTLPAIGLILGYCTYLTKIPSAQCIEGFTIFTSC